MTNHELPTSEWEHSHAVETGDVLIQRGTKNKYKVTTVEDDGTVVAQPTGPNTDLNTTVERWSEEEITGALADGNFETPDGLSHELATF